MKPVPSGRANASAHRAGLVLLSYNQAGFIEAALRSCLAQRGEPLHIVCSDDASTDDSWAILQGIVASYEGPHHVTVRRNDFNLGIAGHYNRLVDESTCELLITAAGDDLSEPDRAIWLLQAWDTTGGRADLVSSDVTDIDREGTAHGVLKVDDLAGYQGVADWVRKRPHVIGASHAFTRRLMQRFGPIDPRLHYEDQIMAFRAIASGGGVTVRQPLVRYRRGGESGRPEFASASALTAWRIARLQREIAEREQLLRDAELASCHSIVAAALEGLKDRQHYQAALFAAPGARERWRALCAASGVPLGWRLRKWLQAMHPGLRI